MKQTSSNLAGISSARIALLVVQLAFICTLVQGQSDRLNPLATGWGFQYNVTAAGLSSAISSGFRLIDLEVRSASPLRFDAAYVTRPGAFLYYLDVADAETILTLATQNGARPVDIERYLVDASPQWSVIMDVSTRGYIFRTDETIASLIAWVAANPEWRMVDIERSEEEDRFHTLFYPNEGVDYAPWWWLVGVSGQAMLDFANNNNARIYDVERNGADSYDALFVGGNGETAWHVFTGQDSATLGSLANGLDARIIDIEYYPDTDRSTVVLLENSLLFQDGFESGDLTSW